MLKESTEFPETRHGQFALFICGSADQILVIPRAVIVEMLNGVPTRRVDIFRESGSLILQTTKHPKLNVSDYLNVFPAPKGPPSEGADDVGTSGNEGRLHIKIQWALIKLGQAEGCSVWVPTPDRNLAYQRMPFSANTLEKLPNFGFVENTRRIVQNIDVLWLKKNVIRKAFLEVESTTSIYSGLLRLNDLAISQPNNQIELYIAASKKRRTKVCDQLMRPSFQSLLSGCRFVAFEHIEEQFQRLESFSLGKTVQVSGLIEGERFSVPDNFVFPRDL